MGYWCCHYSKHKQKEKLTACVVTTRSSCCLWTRTDCRTSTILSHVAISRSTLCLRKGTLQHLSTGINQVSKICHLTPPPQVLLQLLHVPQLAQEEGTGTKLRKSLMAKDIQEVVREKVKYYPSDFPRKWFAPRTIFCCQNVFEQKINAKNWQTRCARDWNEA